MAVRHQSSTDQYADASNAVTKVVGVTDRAVIAGYDVGPALVVVDQKCEVQQNVHGGTFLVFLALATGAEKTWLAGGYGSAASATECYYDQQPVPACSASGVLTGYDAATAQKLWSLPDKTANRVVPGVLVAWHGVLYGDTQGGNPIALDARTGKDLFTEVGIEPYWVSKYAAIGVGEDGRAHPWRTPSRSSGFAPASEPKM